MSEQKERTPGPWRSVETIAGIQIVKSGEAYPRDIATLRHKRDADAAFIVRACNSYDELVAAAEQIESLLSAMGEDDWDEIRQTFRTGSMSFDPLEDLRAALANAQQ